MADTGVSAAAHGAARRRVARACHRGRLLSAGLGRWSAAMGWVLAQAVLMVGYLLLPAPADAPRSLTPPSALLAALLWAAGGGLALRGALDLGQGLWPFPTPRRGSRLVRYGAYGLVRHPIYGGLVLAAAGLAAWHASLVHLAGTAVLLLFLDRKARWEETLLQERFPEYADYRARTRRLIPWIY